jgi:hydrogenase-4 component F
MGLPPFGLFISELTVIGGGFMAHRTAIGILVLLALVASFCGLLQQFTRILLGTPKHAPVAPGHPNAGLPAMALLLGSLLIFSVWLPAPVFQLLRQAAEIIGGKP